MRKLLVILGPTATGKTDLGLRLAGKFNGELVSADSRQVYQGLDIGTGKYPGEKVKIWMYDVADPNRQYSVADYVKDAGKIIDDIVKRRKLPILVGGTGLYLKALLEGLSNLEIPVDKKLRKELEILSTVDLQKRLQQISPERWEKMNYSDRQNRRRLIRAIELAGVNVSIAKVQNFDVLKIGLTAPRNILYERADEQVFKRIRQGMVDEAKRILNLKRMRQLGLEYSSIADYLEGKIKKENLVKIMQGKIHGFIRRQLTWFKNPSTSSGFIHWFDISRKEFPANVEKLAATWYDQVHDPKN